MFWADKLLEGRSGKELVNDSWTPSGIVHMGSLKGPIIHDVLNKILRENGTESKFTYGFDDADVIDGLPSDLLATHEKYMGVPLYKVPAPDGDGTFAQYIGNKMQALLDALGVEAEVYSTSKIYNEGKFDEAIRFVLDNAEGIRKVYGDLYNKEIPSDWFPLQVVCANCGKLGTTKVTAWNGTNVAYSCEKGLVKWAEGCGHSGDISPFGGQAKMPWKVEWAAKWWTFGVTIEGAGKDHASAGGSYDVALNLAEKVFKIKKPLQFGYEFFLVDGKKMSSSKGVGLTGSELLEVIEPRVARFLMIQRDPSQTVEFNPHNKDIIPRVYDDYQKGAADYFAGNKDTDLARAFYCAQIGEPQKPTEIRFSILAQWVQMPNMDDEIKSNGAENWAQYAQVWIEKYAPESERFLIQKETPSAVSALNDKQKEYLSKIADLLTDKISAEDLQTKIYELSKEIEIPSKEAFAAIYIALLGKDHGPKAAWLISSLENAFVRERFTSI